jgi:hypothetical protein
MHALDKSKQWLQPQAAKPCPRTGKAGPRAVLTEAQAIEIYAHGQTMKKYGVDPLKHGQSVALAKQYNVSPKTIRDIWNRRTWTQETRHLWGETEAPMIRRKSVSKAHDIKADEEATPPSSISTFPKPLSPSPPLTLAQPRISTDALAKSPSLRVSLSFPGMHEPSPAMGLDVSEVPKSSSAKQPAHACFTSTARRHSLHDAAILSSAAPRFSLDASSCPSSMDPSALAPPAGAMPTHGPRNQTGGPASAGHFTATGGFSAAAPAAGCGRRVDGGGAAARGGPAQPPGHLARLSAPLADAGRAEQAAVGSGAVTVPLAEAVARSTAAAAAAAAAAARIDPFHLDWPHW